jgi:hypothetical protein
MPSQEDRLTALERKVAALELRRLYDERKAEESTPVEQVQNLREINENMTILLGIASGQEGSIKALEGDVSAIKARLGNVERRLDRLDTTSEAQTALLNQHTTLLNQILARLPEKPQ